jgi:hypothetical protein
MDDSNCGRQIKIVIDALVKTTLVLRSLERQFLRFRRLHELGNTLP